MDIVENTINANDENTVNAEMPTKPQELTYYKNQAHTEH
jgi:hypothetical protein